ncbi:serine/threonine-protein kinase [Nocardiopsis sp. MG754419]|uniref:serine/threonine-protein kinase n=1 Tax=Nocardiopsis sp. MG754419 TaxID=2259865 RepID=UPI001BA7DA6B|nr:serine/threonine-protein kinase [Nocardiopsis sp. MG754419]MBR8741748.1 serine/threonine protein kinase [Nocardiopsis sp. MG754419]
MDDPRSQDTQERVVGGYRLLRSLGRGGFGEVFLGEAEDGTRAAVKLLHVSWSGDQDMRRRFAAEVEQARRVSEFCVARILDADVETDRPWIASEYIDGPTLQDSVQNDGPRTGTELQRLAVSTATALAAIHSAGVVHRDLKPDNIMLAPDGPRVIDFGIARAVEATSVTASGVVGTIGYMAPEQLEGARLTAAVDVFSWAAVMVFAATGREAFPAPTQAARIARILGGGPDMDGVGGPLGDVLADCLAKVPEARPDAATLLQRLIAGPAHRTRAEGSGPAPSVAADATTVTPSPDAMTRVGVDRTRVAGAPPTGIVPVDPTRVAGVDATGASASHAVASAADAGTPSHPQAPFTPSRAGTGPSGPSTSDPAVSSWHTPVPPGGAPPYHFAGARFHDPGGLAEAMQRNWSAAVRVFNDSTERAVLGAWIIDDLDDSTVDRSLFRRQVGDANLAVASFVAQLRPDLPPVFRGRAVAMSDLRGRFADPRPLLTGAPQANEMVLLARPHLLRILGSHHGPEPGAHQRLADDLDRAERAGNALCARLAEDLEGWRSTQVTVNPALVMAFLLNPDEISPPADGRDRGVADWVDILWRSVIGAEPPDSAGYAAAVHAAMPTVQALARQRRYWEGRYSEVSGAHSALEEKVTFQRRMHRAAQWCKYGIVALPIGFVLGLAERGDLAATLVSVGVLALVGFLGITATIWVMCGGAARQAQRVMELKHSRQQLPQLTSGVDRIRTDLDRARRITSG